MASSDTSARHRLRLTLLVAIILLLAISVIGTIYTGKKAHINRVASEYAGIIREPLWNFDKIVVTSFLAVIVQDEYRAVRVYIDDGSLFEELVSKEPDEIGDFFVALNLVWDRTVTKEITKNGAVIGKVEVVWRDTIFYSAAQVFLLGVLLYSIALLYSRVFDARKSLESKVEALRVAVDELERQKGYIEHIFNTVPQGLIAFSNDGEIAEANLAFHRIIQTWAKRLECDEMPLENQFIKRLQEELQLNSSGKYAMNIDGDNISIEYFSTQVTELEAIECVVSFMDVTELVLMQQRLAQTEKLESVGQLAAGIAHEINTPAQYVFSNMDFLAEGFEDLGHAITQIQQRIATDENKQLVLSSEIEQLIEKADWEFLQSEMPTSLEQSKEGLGRIQSIVGAMRRFSHPSGEGVEPNDINESIKTTITVARNEWKYHAEMKLELDPDLPFVPCIVDQFNQVILIMIVNAAHAIEEQYSDGDQQLGEITIISRMTDKYAEIVISDTGTGMPEEVQRKIFDPFFTTKEVNKGTGQGLSIANDIIVNKHQGQIEVSSTLGEGTMFIIRLPLAKPGREETQ